MKILFQLNGESREAEGSASTSLGELLRSEMGMRSVHLGCEHGVCGACTVLVDGRSARSCLMVAPQANGRSVTTAEGLPAYDPMLWDVIENAFVGNGAFQCGFCTSGMVMCLAELLWRSRTVTRADLTEQLSGQVCRCTGYGALLEAFSEVLRYAGLLRDEGSAPEPIGESW